MRSKWKVPYIDPNVHTYLAGIYNNSEKIQKKLTKGDIKNQKQKGAVSLYTTYARSCTIVPSMLGLNVQVHNGRKFVSFKIKPHMIGHKLGEFSFTRSVTIHKKLKKK